jgi:choice-of-anchor C domain-containing protein
MRTIIRLTCVLAMAALCANAGLIINGSFENAAGGVPITGPILSIPGVGALDGWTIVDGTNIEAVNGGYWAPQDGLYSLDMNGVASAGHIQQSFATVIGNQYQVSFWHAHNTSVAGGAPITMRVTAGGVSTDVSVNAGSPFLWVNDFLTFTATGAVSTLDFIETTGNASAIAGGTALDNVVVTDLGGSGQVPEPATFVLLGAGLAALALFKKY